MITLLACSVGCTAEVDRPLKEMKHLSLGIVRMHMVDWERESMEIRTDVWLPGFSSLVTCHFSQSVRRLRPPRTDLLEPLPGVLHHELEHIVNAGPRM
jgi:hypothetical protein